MSDVRFLLILLDGEIVRVHADQVVGLLKMHVEDIKCGFQIFCSNFDGFCV